VPIASAFCTVIKVRARLLRRSRRREMRVTYAYVRTSERASLKSELSDRVDSQQLVFSPDVRLDLVA
jgi:hypothetical protein